MTKKPKKGFLVVSVVASGVLVGTLVGGASGAALAEDKPMYSTNSEGMSFGSAEFAQEVGSEPDLIAAEATNGELGYVLASDLNGPKPTSPEEAATWNERHSGERVINVFESDGKTVIGKFVISSGSVSYDSEVRE